MRMTLIKKILPIAMFLTIITVVWIAFSIYFQGSEVEINPDATNFTKPIKPTFDTEVLGEVTERTEDSFPVSPEEFLNLSKSD